MINNDEIIRNDVRKVQLEILKKIDNVCKKNDLRYYLAFGTCIGALRHKGFIPWDDDIDILMPYADAKKLIGLQSDFGDKYFVQSRETDRDYRSIAMRIRDEDTTCIEADEVDLKTHKGIYVDVYPYYECSNNRIIRLIDILRSNLLKVLVNNRPPVNHGGVTAKMSKIVLGFYSEKKRLAKIEKLEKRLASVKGDEILDYYGQDITMFTAISYPKEWFGEPKLLEFEGMYFNGATEPEKYMSKRYGDYMRLPPREQQVVHHTYIKINPYKSYKEY
ncbi:LicD family protein [Pseudobutyrivibrio sp. MD2005]|uniref:LicD family protein n=1 Tax=Pseudobutyrivibrio sp. MD2005 TaxID=1410616 RepID=UPI000688D68D|nr:LicD family protein [Pseudobutyrivibrio sp. MD2005]